MTTQTATEPGSESVQTDGSPDLVTVTRSSSASFDGGETSLLLTISSERFTREQLNRLLDDLQVLAATLASDGMHRFIGEVLEDESVAGGDIIAPEPVVTVFKRHGAEFSVVISHKLVRPIKDAVSLVFIDDTVSTTIVASASIEICRLALEQARRDHPSSQDYIESLLVNRETPVIELVPPGLAPEHWQEFVERFMLGRPTCADDVLIAVKHYGYEELIDQGISPETAQAVVDNPTLQFFRDEYYERPPIPSGLMAMLAGLGDEPGMPGSQFPPLVMDGIVGLGQPRPRGAGLPGIFNVLGGRRSRRRGEPPLF